MKQDQWVEHLYGVLQEECAELIQSISKRKRFGPWSQNPDTLKTNQQCINDEINDILAVVELLARENERVHEDTTHQENKMAKVRKYYRLASSQSNVQECRHEGCTNWTNLKDGFCSFHDSGDWICV